MKIFSAVCIFLLCFTSCSVDNEEEIATPLDPVNENNTVKVDINGVSFASTDSNTLAQILNDNTLFINGGDGSANIKITIEGYTGTGLYTLDNPDQNLSISYTIPSDVNAPDRVWNIISDPSSQGQVTITDATDQIIEGTFSFTAENESENSVLVFSNGTIVTEVQ